MKKHILNTLGTLISMIWVWMFMFAAWAHNNPTKLKEPITFNLPMILVFSILISIFLMWQMMNTDENS